MCWALEQVNPKRVLLLIDVACLAGMVVGSAVTFAFLSVQRAIPSAGLVVAVGFGVYSDAVCTENLTIVRWGGVYPEDSSLKSSLKQSIFPKCGLRKQHVILLQS